VLWGLTGRGDGEIRYVRSDNVTAHLQTILPKIDLVIGTIEEFNIAGGSTDIMASLRAVRAATKATLVVKRGALGCAVIDGPIPATLDDAYNGERVEVEVLNVLGAGDAFSAGFLSGWVRGEDYDRCTRYANACGALVVSRHGCAPAMPTRVELDHYLARRIPRPDATLTRLHRSLRRARATKCSPSRSSSTSQFSTLRSERAPPGAVPVSSGYWSTRWPRRKRRWR
jgi:5-dehydro-2-deoxygluconokinase